MCSHHAHNMDPGAQHQREGFRPDLQVTHLDKTGERYSIDVTTVDVSFKTYRVDASNLPGAAAAKT